MKALLFGTLALCCSLPATVAAQENVDRERVEAKLRRDQQAIVRKAERLRDLMRNLRERYQKEGRKRQVELLDKGLEHLDGIGLMDTVAGVSNDLDARALAQANQKAEKVVRDLEALLLILLDRPSMEKIDEEIGKTREMEATAAELEKRQDQLLNENRETSKSAASPTEQQLSRDLQQLSRMQRAEAEENLRNAGTRQPFLENALRRIEQMQRDQKDLEDTLRRQRNNPDAKDPTRSQLFDIGALKQETLRQMSSRSRQRNMERVAERARRLQEATDRKDAADTQEARDALRSELERARKSQQGAVPEQIDKLIEQLEGSQPDKLGDTAREIGKQAQAEVQKQQTGNNRDLDQLAAAARQTADKFAADRKAAGQKPDQPENSLQGAAKDLADAAKEGKKPDQTQKTLSKLSQALRKLDEARNGVQRRNPSNDRRAGKMAADAAEAARELRESPGARPQTERKPGEAQPKDAEQPAENRAANRLDEVERQMRQAAENLKSEAEARKTGEQADAARQQATDRQLAESRRQIAEARQALEQALRENGRSEQARQQAAQRQQQLNQQAQAMRDRMQQAQRNGDLSRQQQQAADQAVQRSQQQMNRAEQSLRNNREAQAAREQQAASEELDKARQAMERNRPLDERQKQQLKEQAKRQKKLADDIMRLARLAEERKNQRAKQALDRAAQKAEQAAQDLDQGDNDEAEKKQEEARDALQEAQDELQEERERYEDLRQEELLFKIQEELKQFLTKQEPITKQTEASGEVFAKEGKLPRRSRRRLNELGEEEGELQNKAKYLRTALEEEDVLVFSHALKASEQDLAEVKKRLSGSRPQPDNVTVVLQKDVEDRTRKLIAALKREQKRREEQRKKDREQQDQQRGDQNQQQNNNQNRRQRLVSIVAELEMLKQMEQDMLKRTEFMSKLIETRGDAVSEVDLALLERLAHRHNQITEIFLALKKQVESSLNPEQPADHPGGKSDGGDKPKKNDKGPGK